MAAKLDASRRSLAKARGSDYASARSAWLPTSRSACAALGDAAAGGGGAAGAAQDGRDGAVLCGAGARASPGRRAGSRRSSAGTGAPASPCRCGSASPSPWRSSWRSPRRRGKRWRLTPLLVPLPRAPRRARDTVWQHAPERPVAGAVPPGWLDAHIVFAVATYGLLTIAAVAGVAVFLQERALKAKQPTRADPPLAGRGRKRGARARACWPRPRRCSPWALAERHGGRVFPQRRALLPFDHKTVLSLAAFVVIGALLMRAAFDRHPRTAGGAARAAGLSSADAGLPRRQIRDRRAAGVRRSNFMLHLRRSRMMIMPNF